MGMNSFTLRKAASKWSRLDEELSGILKSHRDGDEFTASCFRELKHVEHKPVDLDSLKKEYSADHDPGRRIAPRFDIEMTVLICNYRKAFRTKTENISATGFRLKDVLPLEFSSLTFDVILIDEKDPQHKTYLIFKGKAIEGPLRTNRLILEGTAASNDRKLVEIIKKLTEPTSVE